MSFGIPSNTTININQTFELGAGGMSLAGVSSEVSNMLSQAMQKGFENFLDNAVSSGLMSQGDADQARGAMDRVVDNQLSQNPTDSKTAEFAQNNSAIKGQLESMSKSITDMMMETFQKEATEIKDEEGNKAENATKGKSGSGGSSWYAKLAIALGKAINDKADQVEALADKVTEQMKGEGVDFEDGASAAEHESKNFDLMQEFQAESKVLQMLQETVKTVVQAIGDTLVSAARKN
jgi:hypothetical protein